MYCGNCGTKIDDNALFCPSCGKPVGENETSVSSHPKTRRINKLLLILPLVAIAFFLFVGIRIYSYITSIPTEVQLLSEVNNYQNGGIVTSDGKWLYYDDNGLCKMHLSDGSKQKVIASDISPDKMYLVGNYIYYYSNLEFHKVKVNSDKEINLDFSVFTEDSFQTDGKKYYVSDVEDNSTDGVYSVNVRNTKKYKRISDISPTKVLMYKDYLYVLSGYNTINEMPNEYYGTWRIDKSGKNKMELLGFCPNYMVFSDDMIYFTDEENTLCSMTLDGAQQEKYYDKIVSDGLNVSDEYVFYLAESDETYSTTIHRMNKDGSGDVELNKESSSMLNIAGSWLFYVNNDHNGDIYRMSFDGDINEPIY